MARKIGNQRPRAIMVTNDLGVTWTEQATLSPITREVSTIELAMNSSTSTQSRTAAAASYSLPHRYVPSIVCAAPDRIPEWMD